MTAIYDWVTGIMNDSGNSYGLLGRNCVDFVRDIFNVAGLGNQISHMMQWLSAPVNFYAQITDWLEMNGFAGIMDGIGEVLGFFGEVAELTMDAAEAAWDWTGDMANAAWDFVGYLGDVVGGFVGDLAQSIADFFKPFGKGNDAGDGDMGTVDQLAFVSGDDFVLGPDMHIAPPQEVAANPVFDIGQRSDGIKFLLPLNPMEEAQFTLFDPPIEDYLFA
ncbi:MAG: hypothetical protein ACI8U3_001948 [Brevundimonas sp.]|jgi:hypothetical protein